MLLFVKGGGGGGGVVWCAVPAPMRASRSRARPRTKKNASQMGMIGASKTLVISNTLNAVETRGASG